jgi:hypothetical protein
MGKASSAKKVARAARAGGRAAGVRQRNLLFPSALGIILLLGVALVAVAWNDHRDAASAVAPIANQDHWHSAFGFYICDDFLNTTPAGENSSSAGIHQHGDGVVHIHPFSAAGAGERATLGTFLDDVPDHSVSNSEIKVGDESWKEGDDTCVDEDGDEVDGEVVVARWREVQTTDDEPSLIYSDVDDLRFRSDGEGYTIAFVPEGTTDIPKPPTASNLAELGALDAGQTDPNQTVPPTAEGGTEPGTEPGAPAPEDTVEGEDPSATDPAEGGDAPASTEAPEG